MNHALINIRSHVNVLQPGCQCAGWYKLPFGVLCDPSFNLRREVLILFIRVISNITVKFVIETVNQSPIFDAVLVEYMRRLWMPNINNVEYD